MKILLIGKYPPMQGGISSKTYWLYKNLEEKGFEFKIITFQDNNYSVQNLDRDSNVELINEKKIPWHVPATSLLPDRLINRSLETVEYFVPDIIETNYLWPFSSAALMISKLAKIPFLIRHAGSDINKFNIDNEFREIMSLYFRNASIVVTNVTSRQFIEETINDSNKVLCAPRYIPDPKVFRQANADRQYDILFVGKINYYWKRKGLILLLEIIRKRKLKALFHIGGKYVHEVMELISSNRLNGYINVLPFVAPEEMPNLYNISRYVWCWEEEGTIDDFSNIIWEALFCNVPCIISTKVLRKPETADLIRNFPNLINHFDSDNINDFEFGDEINLFSDSNEVKSSLFDKYINANISVYQEALKRSL